MKQQRAHFLSLKLSVSYFQKWVSKQALLIPLTVLVPGKIVLYIVIFLKKYFKPEVTSVLPKLPILSQNHQSLVG